MLFLVGLNVKSKIVPLYIE